MKAWLVRAGKYGEREQYDSDHSVAVVGWGELGDLGDVTSREQIYERLVPTQPTASAPRLINHAGQLWTFLTKLEVGDLVALPLKTRPAVAFGTITGPYRFDPEAPPDARHQRPVQWSQHEVVRAEIGQDLLYTLGSALTVCGLVNNDAVNRLRSLRDHGSDPAAGGGAGVTATADVPVTDDADPDQTAPDLERLAADQLTKRVATRFAGHEMARLVDELLKAQGFTTFRSPPGADGGVDVMAGSGPLGMDAPRVCVQVKSGTTPVDVKVIRELQGVRGRLGADQALLVAWSGLTKSGQVEVKDDFFRLRVWTSDDVIRELTTRYDRLPADIQAELPLRPIWALVPDEGSEA